jgi:serine/threonine protein phosphatase PrpC
MGNDLFCANAGDSRAVLCRDGVAVNLSEDHKPMNEEEKTRIEKVGTRRR